MTDREVSKRPFIAFYLKDLNGGGVQNMLVVIANAFSARGYRVALLVCRPEGPVRERITSAVELIVIPAKSVWFSRVTALFLDPKQLRLLWHPVIAARKPSRTLAHLPALIHWLREARPDYLYTATPYMNVEAVLACKAAGGHTRQLVSEHNDLSSGHPLGSKQHRQYLSPLLAHYYRQADAVVAVSRGVADDLRKRTGLSSGRVTVIYNAVVGKDFSERVEQPLQHSWFISDSIPVILGVGRLGQAKDFPTLVRALARVRETCSVRLLILGEAGSPGRLAKRKAELTEIATKLGISEYVRLEGYVSNPLPYMRLASVFALSSLYEGFGNALVEAMACGCPVVSTDCPSGPAEILQQGRYGPLVPVGDHKALADAIVDLLNRPTDPSLLRQRASEFTVERAVDQYEALMFPSQPVSR